MPTPSNKRLYADVKALADRKFEAPTSAYKSAWIVREYIKRGGVYRQDSKDSHDQKEQGLKRWFKEKWVDLERPVRNAQGKVTGYAQCGRQMRATLSPSKYPLCRPSVRVNAATPKTIHEISSQTITAAKKQKQRVQSRGRVMF